jgi:hypothetical protein
MRKAAREFTVVALVIATIAIVTAAARLASHKLDAPHTRMSADNQRH